MSYNTDTLTNANRNREASRKFFQQLEQHQQQPQVSCVSLTFTIEFVVLLLFFHDKKEIEIKEKITIEKGE